MKTGIVAVSVIGLFILTSARTLQETQSEVSQKIIGTWMWNNVIDAETNKEMGIGMVTMGMASEVKTVFKKDGTFEESKLRKDSKEWSTNHGEWKMEDKETLNMKPKDKWKPSKILKLTDDSLLLQMSPTMNLLMIRQK